MSGIPQRRSLHADILVKSSALSCHGDASIRVLGGWLVPPRTLPCFFPPLTIPVAPAHIDHVSRPSPPPLPRSLFRPLPRAHANRSLPGLWRTHFNPSPLCPSLCFPSPECFVYLQELHSIKSVPPQSIFLCCRFWLQVLQPTSPNAEQRCWAQTQAINHRDNPCCCRPPVS